MNSENKVQNTWKAIHKSSPNSPTQVIVITVLTSAWSSAAFQKIYKPLWVTKSQNDSIINNLQYKKLHLLAKHFFRSLLNQFRVIQYKRLNCVICPWCQIPAKIPQHIWCFDMSNRSMSGLCNSFVSRTMEKIMYNVFSWKNMLLIVNFIFDVLIGHVTRD